MRASRFIRLDLTPVPSPSGSAEVVLRDQWSCKVVFAAFNTYQPAVAVFEGCLQIISGYPNDEALRGRIGYEDLSYGFYEALDSSWADDINEQNRLAIPDWEGNFAKRHFVVVFHESLLEVLADDVKVEQFNSPFDEVAVAALRANLNLL